MSQTLPDALKAMWDWYPEFMFQKRVRLLAESGQPQTKIVMDGNAKLARRICGRAVAELMHCAPLGKYSATQCACKPDRDRFAVAAAKLGPVHAPPLAAQPGVAPSPPAERLNNLAGQFCRGPWAAHVDPAPTT